MKNSLSVDDVMLTCRDCVVWVCDCGVDGRVTSTWCSVVAVAAWSSVDVSKLWGWKAVWSMSRKGLLVGFGDFACNGG